MHAQVVSNLTQPIPIRPIGHRDLLGLLPSALKQLLERGPGGLCLSSRNIAEHPIRLMLRNECLGAEIDLSSELLPRSGPFPSLRNELPIAPLCLPLPGTKMSQNPIGPQPGRRRALARGHPITTPGPEPWMRHHLGPDRIEDDVTTEFEEMRLLLHQNRGEAALSDR